MSLPFIPIRAMTIQGSYTGSLAELEELVKLVRNKPPPLIPTKTRTRWNRRRTSSKTSRPAG